MSAKDLPSAQSVSLVEQNILRLINEGETAGAAGRTFDTESLLADLAKLNAWDATDSRDQCFLMSQQFLTDSHNLHALVRLLKQRAQWLGNAPAYGEECRDVLSSAASARLEESIIASVPFGVEKPLECLKRIENLLSLKPGVAVAERSWGYGTVAGTDEFYKRVIVDFDAKPAHSMSFAFAATALKPITPDHMLAVRHADKAAFDELCAKDPARVVGMAIASYGPMTITQLEQEFANKILPAGVAFKDFWSRARNKLKNDKRYVVPSVTRKNDPVMLADASATTGDARWFAALSANKSVPAILKALKEYAAAKQQPSDAQRAVLANRLAFVLKACAATRDDNVKVDAILTALALGFGELEVALKARNDEEFAMAPGRENTVDLSATLSKPSVALNAARKLPARDLKEMVALIPVKDNHAVAGDFIRSIPRMPYSLLETMAPSLLEGCAGAEFTAFVRDAFSVAEIPFQLILWLCRFQDEEQVAKILPASVVGTQAVLAFEPEVTGNELTLQHLIADCFEKREWVGALAARMRPEERAAFYVRIRAVDESVWGPLKKREIEKDLVKRHPELANISAADSTAQENAARRITSLRSYGEFQAQFRDLVENKIPQNARDIDTARSFGDLRENFEYQAARDE
ncbi:MAG: hypothetical protein FWG05_06155, partial [Kiritimatiellaeota bacterium]|nr:hypothetical protein [Kiritimatiellota bacterium]